ncbi:MAG: DUF2723 domain-containing protein [Bacteroidota bacterium]|nr:DUF2723 domain-containing protein [Bacteroidota bacterium]
MKLFKINIPFAVILGFVVTVFVFVVYVNTLAPSVNFIDSGELAAVAATLGIAHPTGYPLFTLAGWLFSHLPIGLPVIYKLNLMSAVLCSVGIFFFFRFLVLLLEDLAVREFKNISQRQLETLKFKLVYLPAVTASLVLAFSQTFWSQAVSIEVYSLHILFLSAILYFFYKAIRNYCEEGRSIKINTSKEWFVFALLLGMSFTNHMTTILLAPALLYLFFAINGFTKYSWRLIFILVVPFIVGLSFYFYLPVRASSSPFLNWGNPVDLEKIFWHLSGKQYRVWIFSSTESAVKQFNYFVGNLLNEFNFLFLLLALVGLWSLFRQHKQVFMFSVLLFVGCVGYSINYDIHDIDSYFLLAYFTLAIWIAVGYNTLLIKVSEKSFYKYVAIVVWLLAFIPLILNYKTCDESKNYLVEDYTKNMFNSIEPNGIIISYQWDYFVSASYYYQFVEKYRSDVVVIDKELLRRSWYFKQLQVKYPWLIEKSKTEIDAFLIELYKFEHNLPYAYELIEGRFKDVIKSFIEKNYDERAIYVTPEIEPQYTEGFQRVPSGLCFQIIKNNADFKEREIEFKFRSTEKISHQAEFLLNLYTKASISNGLFKAQRGDIKSALIFFDQGLKINPSSRELILYRNNLLR